MTSSYVCAGFETLSSIVSNFIHNTKGRYNDNFSREDISDFFSNTCNKFLHSFGSGFASRKKISTYAQQEHNLIKKCRDSDLFRKSSFYIDSGGFQASVGILNKQDTMNLIDIYYNFIREYSSVFDHAFILDVPPGPGCTIFENFKEVEDVNRRTYDLAVSLPDDIRKKIIYIHHFRTPKLWDIYSKLLDEDDRFNKFDYHATGGIVANLRSDSMIPCIIYVIPLIPLLNRAIKYGRTELKFHVLGGANFRDTMFYELLKTHVKKIHNIDLTITFDSSSLFKGLMIGRFIPVLDGKLFKKLDLRSSCLDLRFKNEIKVVDKCKEVIVEMCQKYGLKNPNIEELYSAETNTFFEEVKVYLMLYMLSTYNIAEEFLSKECIGLYSLYEAGEHEKFNSEVELITRDLNSGNLSRKQQIKSYSISNSLDMLTKLDESYCKYLVNKFLSKDEFTNLLGEKTFTF